MHLGNRRPRAAGTWKRSGERHFRPLGEALEDRVLLSVDPDLGGNTVPGLPNIANVPYGMDFGGANTYPTTGGSSTIANQGAGWSVADVGSLNNQPFDDFVIGAPTLSTLTSLGPGTGSSVYLVFASQTVNMTTVTDWIGGTAGNYTPGIYGTGTNRVGDLGITQLGQPTQKNPINTTALQFPFPGMTFYTGSDTTSNLGASVAGIKVNGMGGILLGAPGAPDANNDAGSTGTGRAYLIYGTASGWNGQIGQKINLDDPKFDTDYPGLTLVTFVNSTSVGFGKLGFSVAAGMNIMGDGASDVILGAPGATVDGQNNAGAVYVISTATLSSSTTPYDVTSISLTKTNSSVTLAGANSGDQAGFSVADGGDVNGVTSGGTSVDDLLIGAGTAGGGGAAYLVYGGGNLGNLAAQTLPSTAFYINLNRVGVTGQVPGAVFTGLPAGSSTGFAVSSAGDFNGATNKGTNIDDILIGSPGATIGGITGGNTGQINMFYGAPSTSANYLTGKYTLLPGAVTAGPPNVVLTGADAGDLAGYALANTGFINPPANPSLPTILIGAPGYNGNSGTAYLIPARTAFTGSYSLGTISPSPTAPLVGLQFTSTNGTAANFFGASLSSRIQDGQQYTADTSSQADFIIGSPGYDVTQTPDRADAGGAMVVQSAFIPVPTPAPGGITTNIGVGTPFAPFSINATTPATLQIYVFGTTSTTPNFMPVKDINPATVVVNGVAFPNATLQQDPNTNDYVPAGIPDAIITITPRSALNLAPGTTTITISGSTLSTSPLPNETWTGSATPVTVTGGSVSPVVGGVVGLAPGPILATTFNSAFGNTQFVPTLTSLSAYNYQPIPIPIALNQFLAAPGFRDRSYAFNHPGKHLNVDFQSRGQPKGRIGGFNQLSSKVFDRGKFHPQKLYTWTHNPPKYGALSGVVPVQTRVQRYQDNQYTGG